MIVTSIKTQKVTAGACTLEELLDASLKTMPERGILVITSKVVSLCENRVLPVHGTDLKQLIQDEAEWYMAEPHPQHGFVYTIAHNMVTPNSGIDESNADGHYVLWPDDPQASANRVRRYLLDRFQLKEVGVVITDGNFLALRWGATGISLAVSGIDPLRNYVGQKDLFGRTLRVSRTNVADGIAAAAVLVMGEGAEQTPLAVVQEVPNIQYLNRDPSAAEIAARHTPPEEDMFGQVLTAVQWLPGGRHPHSE